MELTAQVQEKLNELDKKFQAIGQKTETHLEGLLWSKPITYWDYIQTDALLNLQIQRTTLPDEMVFIMYHQINELLFKMMLWEVEQLCHNEAPSTSFFTEKLMRISRYFDMLTTSFDIMRDGMDVEQYMKFRNTLTPASGFQSAQYRLIEFASTDLINLIDYRDKKEGFDVTISFENTLEHLYWQAAGKNRETGEKSYLLGEFERRYKKEFLRFMEEYNDINIWKKFRQLPEADQRDPMLVKAMRHYDYTVNVTWVMGHYNTAKKYIESVSGPQEATGGSDWKKYMHPKYQRRIFFPELWSDEELRSWGENV